MVISKDFMFQKLLQILKVKELTREYKKATSLNRNRIKAMEKNVNPSKITRTWLARRLAIQEEWLKGLNYLIGRVHQGQEVGSLREYMGNKY